MPFKIIRNDITKVKADAIVNTANPFVMIGDGIESVIYEVAGKERLLEARKKLGVLLPGEAGVTEAFDLDAKYLIHVSGTPWKGGTEGEKKIFRSCYETALFLAKERGCTSIAFPLLAAETYGFPKEVGIQVAVDVFTGFLENHDMEILLVVLGKEEVCISGELVEEVRAFVDEEDVKRILNEEYKYDRLCMINFEEIREEEEDILETAKKEVPTSIPTITYTSMMECDALSMSFEEEKLENALKNICKESFEKHLRKLINKKGLKNSEVYAAANISKQYFSKLLKGQVKPSKEKMLALAIGLHLNMDETVDFLRIAGYALSPISQTDAIVEYFISHRDYNVIKLDIVLFDYGLEPLSGS